MQYDFFKNPIIQNLDDMAELLEDHDIDDFYVEIDKDRDEGWKAYFKLNSDSELLAETEGWPSKAELLDDIKSVFGEDVDIIN